MWAERVLCTCNTTANNINEMLETQNTLAKIAANTFASFICMQAGGLSTTFHCYFSAAYALATSPPTSSPGAM